MKRNKFLSLILLVCITLCFFPAEQTFAATKKEPSDQKVSFNFVDVDLGAITKFISEITKKNFIFDERVKGKITIITPSKLSIDDAYNLFVSVLELKGYMVVPSGVDAFKIIPTAEAKQKGIKVTKDRSVNDSYIARLIKLKSISSDDALRLIQPVISKDGYISAFGPANMLLVIDSGLNIEKVLSIIETVDQPYSSEEPEIILLKHSSADAVAKMLNEGMSRKPRIGQQAYAAEEAKAVADTRLNAVVLFGDKGAREAIKSLIRLLDVPSPEAQGRVNVYFLENADAVELAKVMEGMLRGMQPSRQLGGQGAPIAPFEAAGGITITADKATNSLVVVASPADYQNLAQIIKQLDKRRKQVFVEAMIAEVSIDKLLSLGSKWRAAATVNGQPIAVGGLGDFNKTDFGTLQSIITGMTGLSVGGLGGGSYTLPTGLPGGLAGATIPKLAAIFSLDDFKGVVNVLSTPQLLTADNKESEIMVGQNVPFISQMQATPTVVGTTNTSYLPLTSIERQDVGIKLKLTPQITEGDYVKLDIYQEISAVSSTNNQLGPTTDKRSTKTSVVVKDKETVVIGGLMQERTDESVTKVPLLGDIPLLGWLFKQKNVEKKKTNLLVFITPRIVKEADNLLKITKEKQRELNLGGAQDSYYKNEILVKFREGVSEDVSIALITGKGATVTGYSKGMRVYQIRLREGQTPADAVKEFSSMPEVESAELNYMIK